MTGFRVELCTGLSDQDIVSMALKDMEYFGCLVLKYEERLLGYIHNISQSDREEAADILQEAFIKIWKNLNAFDSKLKLESWIFRIVHNETISYWRKKTSFSKNNVVTIDDTEIQKVFIDAGDEESSSISPEKLIEDILPLLKQEYREVLVLKFLEEKSYEEISDILKIPEGTVATRINRAKKSFKELATGHIDKTIFK